MWHQRKCECTYGCVSVFVFVSMVGFMQPKKETAICSMILPAFETTTSGTLTITMQAMTVIHEKVFQLERACWEDLDSFEDQNTLFLICLQTLLNASSCFES